MNGIVLTGNAEKGAAQIFRNEDLIAEMTWFKGGDDHMVIDHTMVDESLKGQGIGRKLLDAVVAMARKEKLRIRPVCPFVVAVFTKTPELHDILYKEE